MWSFWQALRCWFARVGSDPYYASYDRSLGNIKAELDRIQAARATRHKAWAAIRARFLGGFAAAYAAILAFTAYVNHQPQGTYRPTQHAARVAPAFLAPPLGWTAYRLLGWLQAVLDRLAAKRVQQLEFKLRKQVSELKDSTRYDSTLALLEKYDPDYAPLKPERTPSPRGDRQQCGKAAAGGAAGTAQPDMVSRAAGAAANAAGSALHNASARMFPALAQLYSRAADTLMADNPVTLGFLREAQHQSDLLRQRLLEVEAQQVRLLHENMDLKQQLGLSTGEEQAALAAWAAGSGIAGGGMTLSAPAAEAATAAAEEDEGVAEGRKAKGPASDAEADVPAASEPEAGTPEGKGSSASQVSPRKRSGDGGGSA